MRIIFPLLFILLFSAFTMSAQPVPVKIRQLPTYYFIEKSGERLKNGVNYFVITDRKVFEKMFGKSSRADTPQFSKEMVLVMVMPASKKESTLRFERVMMQAGDFVEVYCKQDLNHHKVNYEMSATAVAALPKSVGVKKVIFYDQYMRRLETVEVEEKPR